MPLGYVVGRVVYAASEGDRILHEYLHENLRWIQNNRTAIRYPFTPAGADSAEATARSVTEDENPAAPVVLLPPLPKKDDAAPDPKSKDF